MKTTKGLPGRWLIAICGMAFLLTGTGCSALIGSIGVSSSPGFAAG